MSFDVEPITEEHDDSAWGERKTRTVLDQLRIAGPSGERTIEAHGADGVIQHESGALLDVDAMYTFGEPEIFVETNIDELDDYEYNQWKFTSIAGFEEWLTNNASLASPAA